MSFLKNSIELILSSFPLGCNYAKAFKTKTLHKFAHCMVFRKKVGSQEFQNKKWGELHQNFRAWEYDNKQHFDDALE